MATTIHPRSFGEKLRAELERRSETATHRVGARTVARLIVARNPGRDLEQTRRAVIRWLKGSDPTQPNRDLVTDALGMERGSLDPDPDEEEDPVARATRKMNEALAVGRIDEALQHMAVIARSK